MTFEKAWRRLLPRATFALLIVPVLLAMLGPLPVSAQPAPTPLEALLLENSELVARSSRRTVGPAIDAIAGSGIEGADVVLQRWMDRELFVRAEDGRFFLADRDGDDYVLRHVLTGEEVGRAGRRDVKQVRPNRGVQRVIASALVRFQLTDPDPAARAAAVEALTREPSADQLPLLRDALEGEADADVRALMARAERVLTLEFDEDEAARIAAIRSFGGDLSVEARAVLNPLISTDRRVAPTLPEDVNVARTMEPGGAALSRDDAYSMLVDADLAPAVIGADARDAALVANIKDGTVAGLEVATLDSREARDGAYAALAGLGVVPPTLTEAERDELIDGHVYYEAFLQPAAVTDAVLETVGAIELSVGGYEALDLTLDALSLGSIYFLAAIGLAITFGVMGVINMAHGEFIMMGAYTGYVVQLFVPDKTLSIVLALPLAFAVTFAAGILLERLVIRWLYHRPLETLLATFGVSIALQQLAKNIFGTQARPLTSPDWLAGSWVLNDVVSISYIRIAIFVLAIVFFAVLWLVLNKTRLGLEVRSVTQNRRMAASMGINPERINMLTFGLGSGIAGVAGVAIGLYAQVTSELGQQYIVQSFMTVVVGGVGNVWGTLTGAMLIGFLQKGIEWFNPANTLAAQTFMIVFIIIFIQFRPRGIFALKGRAAEA